MMPGDRLAVAFVEPIEGQTFISWPLHVTIVPWFRTDASTEELANTWTVDLGDTAPFQVRAGEEASFGYRGNKQVDLIAEPTPFFDIEEQIRDDLKRREAWLVDETTKRKRPYRPHVTMQQGKRLRAHGPFVCNRLYIVEQKGGRKEIVGEIPLTGKQEDETTA